MSCKPMGEGFREIFLTGQSSEMIPFDSLKSLVQPSMHNLNYLNQPISVQPYTRARVLSTLHGLKHQF